MTSNVPTNLEKARREDLDKEILRTGMMAELDAISLYEQLAANTERKDIRELFLDIAKEEKTHFGEFEAMLLRNDKQQSAELEKGRKEVEELTDK
jgi:rubrerythrin